MMKRVYLLFAVVAAQLIWLGWNYVDRTREMAEAPVIHIECTDYDPRDLFRGDYVSIRTRQNVPLELAGPSLYWSVDYCREINEHSRWNSDAGEFEKYQVSNPLQPRPTPEGGPDVMDDAPVAKVIFTGNMERLAVFWKKGADGLHYVCRVEAPGSAQDAPEEGETRALMWGDISTDYDVELDENEKVVAVHLKTRLNLSFSRRHWQNMRFYVEEGTGDILRLWLNEVEGKDNVPFNSVRRAVDIVIRENAAAVPRMLYLNGVPYPEAVEQIRNRTFRWDSGERGESADIATP
ncbi:MAG: GDYXXLXY domain-containing protein [Akkermansia sp.]|nr:GDYXXLXY domain-containing protein [Akkermansia sp.]